MQCVALTAATGGKAYIFGIVFDMSMLVTEHDTTGQKWKWSQVKLGGAKYSARCGVALTAAPGGKAYTFGGVFDVENEEEEDINGVFYNDLNCLDLEKLVFRTGNYILGLKVFLFIQYIIHVHGILLQANVLGLHLIVFSK